MPYHQHQLSISVDRCSKRFWLGGDPVTSHFFNALSALVPSVERVVIKILRKYRSDCRSQKVGQEISQLIRQEALHALVHRHCNESLREKGGYRFALSIEPPLTAFLDRLFGWLPRPLEIAMPYAFELYTASLSLSVIDNPELWHLNAPNTDENVRHVLVWHALEELDHQEACGHFLADQEIGSLYRWFSGLALMPFILLFIAVAQLLFMHSDRSLYRFKHVKQLVWSYCNPKGPYWVLIRGAWTRLRRDRANFGLLGEVGVRSLMTQYAIHTIRPKQQ